MSHPEEIWRQCFQMGVWSIVLNTKQQNFIYVVLHTFFTSFMLYKMFFLTEHKEAIVRKVVPASPLLRHPLLDPGCPLFKIFVSPPLCSVPPTLRYFRQFPLTLKQIPLALIWPTNLSWFKQISKGQIYQFNCLSKINVNLLNPFTNRLS